MSLSRLLMWMVSLFAAMQIGRYLDATNAECVMTLSPTVWAVVGLLHKLTTWRILMTNRLRLPMEQFMKGINIIVFSSLKWSGMPSSRIICSIHLLFLMSYDTLHTKVTTKVQINKFVFYCMHRRAQWLRSRASDSRLREPGFESCAAVLKPWASVFTLHCSSSLSCLNEYLTVTVVDMCTSSLRALIAAYGWMLPREPEMVSEWTGLSGK